MLVKTGTFLPRLITRLLGKKMPKKTCNRVCVMAVSCSVNCIFFSEKMLLIKGITLFNILETKEERLLR